MIGERFIRTTYFAGLELMLSGSALTTAGSEVTNSVPKAVVFGLAGVALAAHGGHRIDMQLRQAYEVGIQEGCVNSEESPSVNS